MDIEKIKSKIEKLPESEREEIMKMGELSEEELEKAVGGLSERAKNALFVLGAAALSIALPVAWKDQQNLIAKVETLQNQLNANSRVLNANSRVLNALTSPPSPSPSPSPPQPSTHSPKDYSRSTYPPSWSTLIKNHNG